MPEATETRILLADDHALVRRGVRLFLEGEPDLTAVAEAGDGAEAVEAARAHQPDLAVSPKTVERHRSNLLTELGLKDRLELTRYAIRVGLIEP